MRRRWNMDILEKPCGIRPNFKSVKRHLSALVDGMRRVLKWIAVVMERTSTCTDGTELLEIETRLASEP